MVWWNNEINKYVSIQFTSIIASELAKVVHLERDVSDPRVRIQRAFRISQHSSIRYIFILTSR